MNTHNEAHDDQTPLSKTQRKQAMAFELSDLDQRSLKFGDLFERRFMDLSVSMPLEEALDLGWKTMAEWYSPHNSEQKPRKVPSRVGVKDHELSLPM